MRICVVTAFPSILEGALNESIVKRARESGAVEIELFDLRDFATDKHRQIDDYPYGGGAGMILKAEPFFLAVEHIVENYSLTLPEILLMSPQGERYDQGMAKQFAQSNDLILLCGHYKGVDERVRASLVTRELSIGDYILTGGELPAMVVIDSIARLQPGVLSDIDSARTDSFEDGLLDCPYYTRPDNFRGLTVPDVLLSGHHAEISQWRREQAIARTRQRRGDLIEKLDLEK